MKTAAIYELKAKLSNYLAFVKGGNDLLITDRGTPIAQIVPVSRSKNKRKSLIEIEKQGLIKLGEGKFPKNFWAMPRARDIKGKTLNALLEERSEGR